MERTIEQIVADTILERPIDSIEIEGELYKVASPTIGTLIKVSELISQLPAVPADAKDEDARFIALAFAKDYALLCDIVAVLILGEADSEPHWGWIEARTPILKLPYKRRAYIDKRAKLAAAIRKAMRPSAIWEIFIKRLNMMEVGYFFGITTSLSEINLMRPTRGVGED